jgi:glycosyltransferase involved in cell wall biosynthesis
MMRGRVKDSTGYQLTAMKQPGINREDTTAVSPGTSTKNKLKIIAAIPCLNTEPYIVGIVSEARKYVSSVVVIDDGSSDSTARLAKEAGALVVNHAGNRGYGGAIKSCFEAAEEYDADILVILDGDGQHKPGEITRLVSPIIDGEADLAIGSRFCDREVIVPRYRCFGIRVITWLFNFGSKTRVSDSQSGFRAYRKDVYRNLHLSEKGMSISIETLEIARRRGAVIKEVPITCFYNPSKLNLKAIKHGLGVALSVIRIRCIKSLRRRAGD